LRKCEHSLLSINNKRRTTFQNAQKRMHQTQYSRGGMGEALKIIVGADWLSGSLLDWMTF